MQLVFAQFSASRALSLSHAWPSSNPHSCQRLACNLVNFNQRLSAGCQGSTSFPSMLNRWYQTGHHSSLSECSVTLTITALLIAPGVQDRTPKCPQLMFNVATPQINVCLGKTWDCWTVLLDGLRKELSHHCYQSGS